jgi:hypothetical protein
MVEPAPLCPWREPERDLANFFPGPTRYQTETRILSGERLHLQQLLGRPPSAEENSIQVHTVFKGEQLVGTVLTGRARGEYGVIEAVLALDLDLKVRGVYLQRLREPAAIAAALQAPEWLGAIAGKTAQSDWQLGRDIPDLPPEARRSGQSVLDTVRSLLILSTVAEGNSRRSHHH